MARLACVSGGFDPLHVGHLDCIEAAARLGPVLVLLNSDAWLMRKKGYVLMPFAQRAAILRALRPVFIVAAVDDADGSVAAGLMEWKPGWFVNSGDRDRTNTPETALCEQLGIELVVHRPRWPDVHSSDLIRKAAA